MKRNCRLSMCGDNGRKCIRESDSCARMCARNNIASRKRCIDCCGLLRLPKLDRIYRPAVIKGFDRCEVQKNTRDTQISYLCSRVTVLDIYFCLTSINSDDELGEWTTDSRRLI